MKKRLFALLTALALLLCLAPAALALDESDIIGVWEYDEYYTWFEFDENGCFSEYGMYDLMLDGVYEVVDDAVQTYLSSGEEFFGFKLNGDVLTDSEGDTLFESTLPEYDESVYDEINAVGVWYTCVEGPEGDGTVCDLYIVIYPAGGWAMYVDDEYYYYGPCQADAENGTVYMYELDTGEEPLNTLIIEDDLAVNQDGDIFIRTDLPYEGAENAPLRYEQTAVSENSDADLGGVWKYDDYDLWITIDTEAGTWTMELADDDEPFTGAVTVGGDQANLHSDVGTNMIVVLSEDGQTLTDWDGDTLFRSELP